MHIYLTILLSLISATVLCQRKTCNILGSLKSDVRIVHGLPEKVIKEDNTEIWFYGGSTVRFNNNRVVEFDNSTNKLKVCNGGYKTSYYIEPHKVKGEVVKTNYNTKSKSETLFWLASKINSYLPEEIFVPSKTNNLNNLKFPSYYIKNPRVLIDTSNLIFDYTAVEKNISRKVSHIIPIEHLELFYANKGQMVFVTKADAIQYIEPGNSYSELTNFFSIDYNFGKEPGIEKQIRQALSFLKYN